MPYWAQGALAAAIALYWSFWLVRDVATGVVKWRGWDPIHRETQPVSFWATVAFWAGVCAFMAKEAARLGLLAIHPGTH
jgi:hypothetical protein